MISFKFEMSDVVKDFVIKRRRFEARLIFTISAITFFIPAVVFGIAWRKIPYAVLIITIVYIVSLIMLFLLCRYNSPLNAHKESEPEQIIINNDSIETTGRAEYCHKKVNLYDIKSVIDYGLYYVFVFYFPNLDRRFICQKDLITEGTIEEFEEIFKDKIVRKTK